MQQGVEGPRTDVYENETSKRIDTRNVGEVNAEKRVYENGDEQAPLSDAYDYVQAKHSYIEVIA